MKIMILGDIQSSHTQKWVEGVCASGIEVGVFSLRKPTGEWINKLSGLTVFYPKKTTGLLGKIGYLGQVKSVRQYIQAFQPDIIHAHYATSYGLLGALNKGIPFFVSVWGSDVFEFPRKSFIHKSVLKFIFRKSDRIFSTSHIMAAEIKKYTSKDIMVIPFGVDTNTFFPQPKSNPEKLVLGTVKTLEFIYGIDMLIAACIALKPKFPNLECHIYGQGSLEKTFKQTIQENNALDYIYLKGAIPHQDVPKALTQMDIFCNLSREESFGVAVLEASSCEIPIVATRIGGLMEVVIENETGFLADVNVTDIVSKIETLIKDVEKRKEMGKNGRVLVQHKYEWNKNLNQMIEYYSK
jgi:glycosyltransferase involved in cell wall biosynthesis